MKPTTLDILTELREGFAQIALKLDALVERVRGEAPPVHGVCLRCANHAEHCSDETGQSPEVAWACDDWEQLREEYPHATEELMRRRATCADADECYSQGPNSAHCDGCGYYRMKTDTDQGGE